MQIHQLRYVLAVAENKSFSAAAKKLFLAQPSLSQQIINLEKELGIALFVRHPKSVTLTDAGEQFLKSARRIVNEVDQLSDLMQKHSQLQNGTLRIGLLWVASYLNLSHILTDYHRIYPGISYSLTVDGSNTLLQMLDSRSINAAFVISSEAALQHKEDLFSHRIMDDRYVAIVSRQNPLSARPFISHAGFACRKISLCLQKSLHFARNWSRPFNTKIVQIGNIMAKKHLSEDEIKLIISGDSSKLQEELHTLTKETKALKKEEAERRKAMVELEAQGKKNTKDYQNLAKECKDYTAKISKNNEKISLLTRNLKVNDLTMRQLKKEAKELSAALDDMTESANPEEYAKLNTRLREVRARMSELRSAGNNMNNEFGNSVNWMSKLKMAAKAFIAVKVAGWLKDVHNQAYETRKEFAKYEAVLRNTFQSQKKANDAMKMLQQLAADTPSSLQEWTEAYIKLVNRGVKPTSQELVNMGDLAASQGKSVDQLIEAILDAMAGENERLKEFGIKASKSGETTKFSFRGVTTEVRNSEDAIKDYLLSLGRVDGIAGSMAVQMQELEGIQSNLGDTMDAFFNKVGKKLEPFWKSMLKYANGFFTKLGEMFATYTETYENHFDKMVQLESALPGLLNRYEELTGKSSRSAEEQKELASVIAQIRNMVPGAATAFDQYGNAIEISGEKVEEFLKKQRALLKFENQKAIRETTEQLEEYRQAYKNLLEQQKQGGRTVFQSNGMFAAPTAYINTEALPQIEQDIKKYGDLILGAEEKLKQLNGQTIEETVKNQQKLAEARQNFNKMEKVQLQAWIKNNKDAAGEYVEIAQEIYNKRFPAEDPDTARKKMAKVAKEVQSAAEKEQKAKISTEQEAVKTLETLREEELQSQQKWYNDSFAALSAFQASGKMSKEQHEMLLLELEKSYAENRLIIEQSYYEDAKSMAISNAETKENLVRKSNQRVIDAEKAANAKRASLQEKLKYTCQRFQIRVQGYYS